MRTAEQRRNRLFLLAGLLRDTPELGDANWRDTALWQKLVPLADAHGVATALPFALKRAGLWTEVPQDLQEYLEALHYLNAQRTQAQLNEALFIHDLLKSAGVECVFLKGAAYQFTGLFDDDPAMRSVTDIDILVEEDRIADAENALAKQGYCSKDDAGNPFAPIGPYHHHRPVLVPAAGKGEFSIEIHIQVGNLSWAQVLPEDYVLQRKRPIEFGGRRVRIPSPGDMLVHALIHAASSRDYYLRRFRLRHAIDLNRLWQAAERKGGVSTLEPARGATKQLRKLLGAYLLLQGHPAHLEATRDSCRLFNVMTYGSGLKMSARLERKLFRLARSLIANPRDMVVSRIKRR